MDFEAYYSRLREQNRMKMECAREDAYSRCPELKTLQEEKGRAFRMPPEEGRAFLASLKEKQDALLASLGLAPAALDLKYTCPLCRDTGYTGDTVKEKCACRLKLEQEALSAGARITAGETFEAFREDIFPDEEQKNRAIRMKAFLEEYAASLPAPAKPQLLLYGLTGLGKSFFGNALAARAVENGIASRRITAYQFLSEVTESFSKGGDPVSRYSRVPFLVLDDLGAEALIPNVTVPALTALVDSRLSENRPTVYITNLSPAELMDRYGERVSSRIEEKRSTTVIRFRGNSLRDSI